MVYKYKVRVYLSIIQCTLKMNRFVNKKLEVITFRKFFPLKANGEKLGKSIPVFQVQEKMVE